MLTKDEMIQAVIETFGGSSFAITKFDATMETLAVRFTVNGHRFRMSESGRVDSVLDGMLSGDLPAKLAELALRPSVERLQSEVAK